jgi:hypothetical protein
LDETAVEAGVMADKGTTTRTATVHRVMIAAEVAAAEEATVAAMVDTEAAVVAVETGSSTALTTIARSIVTLLTCVGIGVVWPM